MRKRGFTLVELLVVIAVIGVLSGIVLASLNVARMRARNAQRLSDLQSLQRALEMYKADRGTAPVESIYLDGVTDSGFRTQLAGYISKVPVDPTGTSSSNYYYYCNYSHASATNGFCEIRATNDPMTYAIKFTLEGSSAYYCLTSQGIHRESDEDDSTDLPTESATACEQR